jgi:hypothetical protein
MPSFAESFQSEPDALEDLVIFLESLALPRARPDCARRPRSAAWLDFPCAGCHAGGEMPARGWFGHRCVYLLERRGELSCRRCHPQGLAATARSGHDCPLLAEHRGACTACHDPAGGRSP